MGLGTSLNEKKYDLRLVEWNLENGVLSQEEYDNFMANLEDSSFNAEPLNFVDDNDDNEDNNGNEESDSEQSPLIL